MDEDTRTVRARLDREGPRALELVVLYRHTLRSLARRIEHRGRGPPATFQLWTLRIAPSKADAL